MGTEKPMGNHPSHTANTMSSRSPIQNVGDAAKTKQYPFTTRSTRRPSFSAATTPRANPSTPETTQATPMSASEFSAREAMTSVTGML